MRKDSKYITFLNCLQFSVMNSLYSNVLLKPKQVICLEKLFFGINTLAILPTGYGKSLIYQLLPLMLYAKIALEDRPIHRICVNEVTSVLLVISPLNALINDQVRKLCAIGLRASAINVVQQPLQDVDGDNEEIDCDVAELDQKTRLINGYYNLLFAHPEALISSKFGRELVSSATYRKNVCAIVIDEAHCILEWGGDFRRDYAKLSMLCAVFPDVPVIAMTATANKLDRSCIKESLGLHKCYELIVNPDRRNIFYKKTFRYGQDTDSFEDICRPIAIDLLHMKIGYPLTIIYMPLKWCGFVYRLFETVLGINQYYPSNSPALPKNRLFAQFHAPQTPKMKEEILEQLSLQTPTIRVILATVAFGMGVDIRSIRQIIHIGPPRSIREYFQETGRAGRDGESSKAVLYYNNRDIAKNKQGLQDEMRMYCLNKDQCLRTLLLQCLDIHNPVSLSPEHLCCSVCKAQCLCVECNLNMEATI